jgi:hypothetical protein
MRDQISQPYFLQLGNKYDSDGSQVGRKEQIALMRGIRNEFREKAQEKLLSDPEFVRLSDRYYAKQDAAKTVGEPRNLNEE